MPRRNQKGQGQEPKVPRLEFVGLQPEDKQPSVCIIALNQEQERIHLTEVKEDGTFDLPDKVLQAAHRIIVGPISDDDEELDTETSMIYRAEQFAALMELGNINIAQRFWRRWFFFTTCVTGSVEKCTFLPWWWENLSTTLAAPIKSVDYPVVQPLRSTTLRDVLNTREVSRRAFPDLDIIDRFPIYRCETVCYGTVEVYQRRCCCDWIIDLGWLDDLVRELEDLVEVIPIPDPFPPDPIGPEIAPRLMNSPLFAGDTLNQMALNAHQDLHALNHLPMEQIEDYILARPYLRRCSCGRPSKVAEGDINPDGTFNICWFSYPVLLDEDCHYEYAYVIKQTLGDHTVTIYNGLVADQWFDADDDPTLKSTSPFAIGCFEPEQPLDDPAVFLEQIGNTASWNLETPMPDSWNSVNTPSFNSGLVFPADTDAAAAGEFLNCNWGGVLNLRYMFTWQLKHLPEKPRYYRVSWVRADANGNPEAGATRYYFKEALAWYKFESGETVPETLGPVADPATGDNTLYEIPYYDGTVNWTSDVTYHARINTENPLYNEPGQYLVTLELFDENRKRLHPTGTPPIDAADVASDFQFLRWENDPAGPDQEFFNVPHGALTHMLWWDNRPVNIALNAVYLNGVEFDAECMFLTGEPTSTVALAYRAYHENPRFLYRHRLRWIRGFGPFSLLPGAQGTFANAAPDALGAPVMVHGNVGTQPLGFPPGISGTQTFAQMLNTAEKPDRQKCTFTVKVAARAKTTNGSRHVSWIDQPGSFALDMTDPCAGCEDC